ncbi:glycosyl hydrolase family 28-related protein [Kutzneria chonburiensis]|uniref:Glycosyl hydrolase family 28-related protein n=1 Tax=Kutzneria chonburiensis TaxID=1483604 RepID=A0ABV6MY45_9PSEU|nr:glycosyl hydrolase family 28-related protein [Kutzneria chonburiensis]
MTTSTGPAPVRVNVLDHGAVPDGVTDCTAAFQAAVDAIDNDVNYGGGIVYVPAAPNVIDKDGKVVGQGRYRLDRSVIVDKSRVRIVGDDARRSVISTSAMTPAFIFGLYRGTRTTPMSTGHWADLSGILDDSVGQRWGYRLAADGERVTVSLPASPFALGPTIGGSRIAVDNWASVSQLTLDFVVQNNSPGPWVDFQPLFGMVDFDGRPAPWYAQVRVAGTQTYVRFCFRTTDGLYRELGIPFDGSEPLLRCSLQLDLADPAGAAAWVGHTARSAALVQVPVDTSQLNDFMPGTPLSFVANDASPFQLGVLSPAQGSWRPAGAINSPNPGQDLTFAALRLTAAPRYVVETLTPGANPPQKTLSGRQQTDLDLLVPQDGGFATLPMDEAVRMNPTSGGADKTALRPDFTIPWCSDLIDRGYGLLVSNLNDVEGAYGDNISYNAIEHLTIQADRVNIGKDSTGKRVPVNVTFKPYGQAVALGLVYYFSMKDVVVEDYAQGLSAYHLGVAYTINVRDCEFNGQSDTGIYGYGWMFRGDNLGFSSYGRSAITAVRSGLTVRDVFVSPSNSPDCEAPVRLYEPNVVQFDNFAFDLETTSVRDSYFRITLASDVGLPQLTIRDCQGGLIEPGAAYVRLISQDRNAGIATSGRPGGWCSIERSFTEYVVPDVQALVAVDGPLWQGTFTGLPPDRPELVTTTARVGASARIGVGGIVPPALTVPAPVAGDPLLTLPGLVAYFRADGAQNPNPADPPHPLAAQDGMTFVELADHASPQRVAKLATGTTPAVYRANVINGLPALSFTAGNYTLPMPTTTSGEATVFLVSRGQPFLQTGNLWMSGHYWGVANVGGYGTAVNAAGSDTAWIVHALRYTVRANPTARVLQTWANGQPYDTKRFDGMQDVNWTAFSLGSGGGLEFTGELSTAVFFDVALTDAQVELVNRYLLHRHRIAV